MYELLLIIPIFFVYKLYLRTWNTKSIDHISLIFLIWLIASFCGFLYSNSNILYQGKGSINIESIVYMLLMFHITMHPIQKSCILTSQNYITENSSIIVWAMYILAVCSFLPFLENILHLGSGNTIFTLSDNYGAQELTASFDARAHMSWLGARLNSVTLLCKYITPILLMNYLSCLKKKKKWVIIGLIMGIFNPAIYMFNMGSRWVAIEDILFFIFLYLLYKKIIPSQISRYIQFIFISIGCILTIGIISITIGRFENTDYSLNEWLYRYIGEGFANFSTDMWYVNHTSNGMHIFRTFYDNAITKLNDLMGIRMYVFYTYIGDFFADWGTIGCFLICLILGMIGKKIFSFNTYKIYNVFVCSMYCKIFLTGFMYLPYINTLPALTIASIFFFLCKCNSKVFK
jgi:oligosaccharide repeat unit polymerase